MIDYNKLVALLGMECCEVVKRSYNRWVEEALRDGNNVRESRWTQSIAVESEAFVKKTKEQLGVKAKNRKVQAPAGGISLELKTPVLGPFILVY